jgi:serine protease Do
MKSFFLLATLAVFSVLTALTGCQTPTAKSASSVAPAAQHENVYRQEEDIIKKARDMVYPATVRVEARKTEFFGGEKKHEGGFGSGVIFDPQGHILTNYHVAGRADQLSCTLYNKERVKAKLIGADPWTDLAVIQLDLAEVKEKGITFSYAPFGDSSLVSEGDRVLTIGSPFGLSRSICSGIISCHDRILGEAMDLGGGLETGLFNTWFQTDAAINPGNSGGPLVNFQGEVIGINTRGSRGANELGFAIPINVAKEVIRQILSKGKVTRSDVGLTFQPLQDLESFFVVGKTEGAVVSSVDPDGPAAKAGVKPQDLLIEYNGHAVAGRYPEELFELRRLIADTPVGATAPIRLKRGSKTLDLKLVTVELTTVRSEEVNFEKWGFVGQNITSRLAERDNLKDSHGVYITGVRAGEPAEKVEISRGTILFHVKNSDVDSDVADVDQLKKIYDASVAKKETKVLLKFRAGPAVLLKVLKIDYDQEPAAAKAKKEKDAKPADK